MGQTLQSLAKAPLEGPRVFDRRFVVELCERVHVHYRNLRIQLGLMDFIEVGQGMAKAHERWITLGRPMPKPGEHIELCRRQVAQDAVNEGVQVNLNANLYLRHEGRIYAEGADLRDPEYIHLKIGDLRLEMTVSDFRVFANTVKEADDALAHRDPRPVLPTA